MDDLFNGISHVVASHAIQDVDKSLSAIEYDALRIAPQNIYNFDTVSCDISKEIIELVRLPAGVKANKR